MKTKNLKDETSLLLGGILSLALALGFFGFHFFELSFASSPSHSFIRSNLNNPSPTLVPETLPAASQLALGQKIDLNRASAADLEALPEVGPKLAEEIVKNRKAMGRFVKIEDLMRVKGIKKKKFEKLKNYLQV